MRLVVTVVPIHHRIVVVVVVVVVALHRRASTLLILRRFVVVVVDVVMSGVIMRNVVIGMHVMHDRCMSMVVVLSFHWRDSGGALLRHCLLLMLLL